MFFLFAFIAVVSAKYFVETEYGTTIIVEVGKCTNFVDEDPYFVIVSQGENGIVVMQKYKDKECKEKDGNVKKVGATKDLVDSIPQHDFYMENAREKNCVNHEMSQKILFQDNKCFAIGEEDNSYKYVWNKEAKKVTMINYYGSKDCTDVPNGKTTNEKETFEKATFEKNVLFKLNENER